MSKESVKDALSELLYISKFVIGDNKFKKEKKKAKKILKKLKDGEN